MKTMIFKHFQRLLICKKFFVNDDDPFAHEAKEGLNMFPNVKSNIFRLKFRLRVLLMRSVWIAFSLPVKVMAISGCLAAVSGTAILIQRLTTEHQHNDSETQKEQNTQYSFHIDMNEDHAENEFSDQEESKTIHYYNICRTPNPIKQMQKMPASNHYIVDIETENHLIETYSIFPEMHFHNLRFVDFSRIFQGKTSLLLPVFSGLEARFENRESVNLHDSYMLSDTVGYYDFLERIALHIHRKQFDEAEHLLVLLVNQRPSDENGLFYIGYIHFMKGKHQKAIIYFEKCKQTPYKAFYKEACYYATLINSDQNVYDDATSAEPTTENPPTK